MDAPCLLVVDDEPAIRDTLAEALRGGGFAVDTACSGSEALDKFKAEQHRLVISDVKMPVVSGMEVLRKIKRIAPHTPVIMMTAFGTVNNAVETMQLGAADYILKPFALETLAAAVKRHIRAADEQGRAAFPHPSARTSAARKQIITQAPEMLHILRLAQNVAPSRATVLIQGESGTGKELLAAFIHQHSGDAEQPFVAVNCAALPDTLAESELFGHEKGAFTGAQNRKLGKFELAQRGTIVLDEISEMALPLQAKLLRVLQEREVDRVGGSRPVPVEARVIAISNVDLKQCVWDGKFREDLFYRLNVIPLAVPPLRERKSDIPLLAGYFFEKYVAAHHKPMRRIAEEAMALLGEQDWKGNIRELENTIERAVLVGSGAVLLPEHLLFGEPKNPGSAPVAPLVKVGLSVREMEKELICRTLQEVDQNRTRAAAILGVSIRTLRNKLREYKEEMPGRESSA
ncbi:MAG: sigma-54-dependent Fis family transcriptional regulator [Desulfobacterales bacterium]|nr:MAG: sigma-54-dependent Fis family transcriptional regulator [Desulfobacterales bacterium]